MTATETRTASELTATFEMNGKAYATDHETLNVLRSCMPGYKATGDVSAVACVMHLGLRAGRIVEMAA